MSAPAVPPPPRGFPQLLRLLNTGPCTSHTLFSICAAWWRCWGLQHNCSNQRCSRLQHCSFCSLPADKTAALQWKTIIAFYRTSIPFKSKSIEWTWTKRTCYLSQCRYVDIEIGADTDTETALWDYDSKNTDWLCCRLTKCHKVAVGWNKYDYNYLIIFFLNCCNIVINLVKFDAWYKSDIGPWKYTAVRAVRVGRDVAYIDFINIRINCRPMMIGLMWHSWNNTF